MAEDLVYGREYIDKVTFVAIAVVGTLLALAMSTWHVKALWQESAQSFVEPWAPLLPVMLWRIIALGAGVWAVISMFRVGPGNMEVLMHEERTMVLLHPVNFEKFVTFSSWTLLSNILYFASVITATILETNGNGVPFWLQVFEICMLSIACGSAFLTATIVRHVILPAVFNSDRDSDFLFTYHEQVMHNFAAIFLAVELVIVAPTLHPEFALYCVGMGLVYVLFAYVFAYQGGGYYVYSFIDPRLRYAPIVMSGLAAAIAAFYLAIYVVSLVVQMNTLLGTLLIAAWVAMIVQFRPTQKTNQSSS